MPGVAPKKSPLEIFWVMERVSSDTVDSEKVSISIKREIISFMRSSLAHFLYSICPFQSVYTL